MEENKTIELLAIKDSIIEMLLEYIPDKDIDEVMQNIKDIEENFK